MSAFVACRNQPYRLHICVTLVTTIRRFWISWVIANFCVIVKQRPMKSQRRKSVAYRSYDLQVLACLACARTVWLNEMSWLWRKEACRPDQKQQSSHKRTSLLHIADEINIALPIPEKVPTALWRELITLFTFFVKLVSGIPLERALKLPPHLQWMWWMKQENACIETPFSSPLDKLHSGTHTNRWKRTRKSFFAMCNRVIYTSISRSNKWVKWPLLVMSYHRYQIPDSQRDFSPYRSSRRTWVSQHGSRALFLVGVRNDISEHQLRKWQRHLLHINASDSCHL